MKIRRRAVWSLAADYTVSVSCAGEADRGIVGKRIGEAVESDG